MHRQQVWLREVAVVVRQLLAAHGPRLIALGIVEARFAGHLAAPFEDVNVPRDLVPDGAFDEAERVQVLDFGAFAKRLLARSPHGHVGVATHRTLVQVAIGDAQVARQRPQLAKERGGFGGGAQIGFRHHLKERCAGAVEVDARHAGVILMQRLAGILLQVGPRDADAPLAGAGVYRHGATGDHRRLELADLITLRQVRIEVVLAVEPALAGELRLDGEAEGERHPQRFAIEHRQGARQAQVDGAR